MNKEDVVEIGYFQKPHGYKGQMGMALTTDDDVLFDKINFVLLEINNLLTPFFVEKIESKHKILIKLENCSSDAEAKKFQSQKIFIPKELVVKNETEAGDDYVGFIIIDKHFGELGKIERMEEMPGSDVFVVMKEGKEILLPVIDDFILEINESKKTISYDAPEGLISMYLE